VSSAMGTGATALAIGELGASHTSAATGYQTATSSLSITLDTSQLDPTQDLELGLYGGTLTGTGVSRVVLDVNVGGVDLLNQSFGSGSAALAYFKNHAIDLGSVGATSALTVTVSLRVTTSTAGSAFDTGILVGAQAFVTAMASMTPAVGQSVLTSQSALSSNALTLAVVS
jgi:hypothetical protein